MTLGERMKEYEFQSRTRLLRRTPVIVRLDGKAFHSFTRGFDKPFDENLMRIMQDTTKMLCENIQGCVFGYTQSDEITLILVDYKELESCAWYDNQVQKICSVASSIATNAFNEALSDEIITMETELREWNSNYAEYHHTFTDEEDAKEKAIIEHMKAKINLMQDKLFKGTFDARAFNLPAHEVINNLIWRQQDATRNSINSLAQSLFPHKQLQGLNCKTVQDKMFIEKDVNWNNLTTSQKRGTAVLKDEEGKWYIDYDMPILTDNRDYINKLIIFE